MTYRVVYGIKLFRRVCPVCRSQVSAFWVPKSSPQKYCSLDCEKDAEGRFKVTYRNRKAKRVVAYDLTEDDYYDTEID